MESRFGAPNDSVSSASSDESASSDHDHVGTEEVSEIPRRAFDSDGNMEHEKRANRETAPFQGTRSLTRVSSTVVNQLPNLPQSGHLAVLLLGFMEEKCKSKALEFLNSKRKPEDQLSAGDPEVVAKSKELYAEMSAEMRNSSGLPPTLAGSEGEATRQAYVATFDNVLTKVAEREHQGSNPTSPRRSKASITGLGFLPGGVATEQLDADGSVQSLMTGANKSYFGSNSCYKDEYQEISLLGQGGYGQVFRARNHLDNAEYAVKKIHITSRRLKRVREKNQIQALLAEVRALSKLSHTNIVRYYHAWVETENPPVQNTTAYKQAPPSSSPAVTRFQEQETSSAPASTWSFRFDELQRALDLETVPAFSDPNEVAYEDHHEAHDVVFAYSSATYDHSLEQVADRQRRASHATTTSTLKSSVHSVNEYDDDPDVELIPRGGIDNKESSFLLSKFDGSVEQPDIGDTSQTEYFGPDIILYIKMSLHPMTLSTYLSWEPPLPNDMVKLRHCFHEEPSVGLLAAILDGMQYLHARNLVHRDLKPANIFLSIREDHVPSTSGYFDVMACPRCNHIDKSKRIYVTPCIGDFGLIAEIQQPTPSAESNPTTPGTFEASHLIGPKPKLVGTYLYRPSSLPKNEPMICPRWDVYSFGVITLEMIYKFTTNSERMHTLMKIKDGVVPGALEDHAMMDGILSMTKEDRDERWGCEEVREWLLSMEGMENGRA
jgi:translation initiation factor 2-alpha kinase 3